MFSVDAHLRIDSPIQIIGTGDWHLEKGIFRKNPNLYIFAKGAFYDLIQEIKQPNTYWIMVGDMFNDHRTADRLRQGAFNDDGRLRKLSADDEDDMDFWDRKLIPTLKKIAHKCLLVVRGNHYRRYNNGDTNIDYICRQTGLTDKLGEHRGYLNLHLQSGKARRRLLRGFVTHASGGAPEYDIGKLKKQSATEDYHFAFGGHTHGLGLENQAHREVGPRGIRQKGSVLVRCGSLRVAGLPGMDTYEDYRDYGAKPTGFGVLEIRPRPGLMGNLDFTFKTSTIQCDKV